MATNQSDNLRACPFCGREPTPSMDGTHVACLNHDCLSSRREQWNSRPLEDALTARIAELEAKIARLVEVGDKVVNNLTPQWVHALTGDPIALRCPICHKRIDDETSVVMIHTSDCPITLWNKEAHE